MKTAHPADAVREALRSLRLVSDAMPTLGHEKAFNVCMDTVEAHIADLEARLAALAGAAPVAGHAFPSELAKIATCPASLYAEASESICQITGRHEQTIPLFTHAPAKAREVTDADVERALNCKPFTSERAVQYLPMSKPDAMTFMRAATFAEGESLRHVDHPDCNHCYSLWADKQEGEE